MAILTIEIKYDLHVKCDLCKHEWIDEDSSNKEKLKCPNCENLVSYEVLDIRFKTKKWQSEE